jgi:hypothetical protein
MINADIERSISLYLRSFVIESWKIEGYTDVAKAVLDDLVLYHRQFLHDDCPTVESVHRAAVYFTGGNWERGDRILRNRKGLDVRVGSHEPPRGGDEIEQILWLYLKRILDGQNQDGISAKLDLFYMPLTFHVLFEKLHPFLDGNGRVGRLLWLWQSVRLPDAETRLKLGFLHSWYYESLACGLIEPQPLFQ